MVIFFVGNMIHFLNIDYLFSPSRFRFPVSSKIIFVKYCTKYYVNADNWKLIEKCMENSKLQEFSKYIELRHSFLYKIIFSHSF